MRMGIGLMLLALACSGETGQHEITAAGELLAGDGQLREPGWARRQLLRWDPAKVREAERARLRQWDFFTVMDASAGVAVNFTLVDLGFLKAATVGVVDLATGEKTDSLAVASDLALSQAALGRASGGEVMTFEAGAELATIRVDMSSPALGPPVVAELTVGRRAGAPYLSLATPFAEDPRWFFFEQKVPWSSAAGRLTVGEKAWTLGAGASAVMDWGRGVWPERVTWRWAGAVGPVALNLGDGFGKAEAGTENLVASGDVVEKLGEVTWTYDVADPMREWSFRSEDGRLALVLVPIAKEVGGLELGAKYQRVTKAYGWFRGRVVVGGKVVEVGGTELFGFAEQVDLSW